jgi:hypothetical protein
VMAFPAFTSFSMEDASEFPVGNGSPGVL